jgi:hypothetical protein
VRASLLLQIRFESFEKVAYDVPFAN